MTRLHSTFHLKPTGWSVQSPSVRPGSGRRVGVGPGLILVVLVGCGKPDTPANDPAAAPFNIPDELFTDGQPPAIQPAPPAIPAHRWWSGQGPNPGVRLSVEDQLKLAATASPAGVDQEWLRRWDEEIGLKPFVAVKLRLSEDQKRVEEIFVDVMYPNLRVVRDSSGHAVRSEFVKTPLRERKRTRYWGDAGWLLTGPGIDLSELLCIRPPGSAIDSLEHPELVEDLGSSPKKTLWLTLESDAEGKQLRGRLLTRVVERPNEVEEVASWIAEPWPAADAAVEQEVTDLRRPFQK